MSSEKTDKSGIFAFICSDLNVSSKFTVEKMYGRDIWIRKILVIFLFWYFNQGRKTKDLKSKHFTLFCLKTDSLFNLTLKDMYNLSYIQTWFFGKNIHLMDSGSWSVSYALLGYKN